MIEAEFCFEVGERIRKKRLQRKMSRETLAKIVGVHRNSIWRWEEGDAPMPLWYFLQVCYALQIPYFSMLPGEDLRNSELRRWIERENLPAKKSVQSERDPQMSQRALLRHTIQRQKEG